MADMLFDIYHEVENMTVVRDTLSTLAELVVHDAEKL